MIGKGASELGTAVGDERAKDVGYEEVLPDLAPVLLVDFRLIHLGRTEVESVAYRQ